jgi:hypothetical protein
LAFSKKVGIRLLGLYAIEDVTSYNEWFMGSKINKTETDITSVVKVDDVDNALAIRDQIRVGYRRISTGLRARYQ